MLAQRKMKAHKESLILGETFDGVMEVPKVVSEAVTFHGLLGVVCIFDQNMHWPDGSIMGTQLCKQLRDQNFVGLIIIRSANDRYVANSLISALRVGSLMQVMSI